MLVRLQDNKAVVPITLEQQQTWWFMMVAANLWISRSSWSAKSLDFVAAADKPHMAACLTVSGEMDDEGPVSEDCIYNNILHNMIIKERELLIWGNKALTVTQTSSMAHSINAFWTHP